MATQSPSRWFTANYLFRGVLLGPGDHKVRFVYRPRTFYLGLAITAVTAITLAVYGLVLRRKKTSGLATTSGLPE